MTAPLGARRAIATPAPAGTGWAVLILVGTLPVMIAALLRPGGSVQADQHRARRPLGTLVPLPAFEPGSGLEQSFVADADGLSQVSVRFGTYARSGTGTVVVRLLDRGRRAGGGGHDPAPAAS